MVSVQQSTFTFSTSDFPNHELTVLGFDGEEQVNSSYRFSIELASFLDHDDLPQLNDCLPGNSAILTIDPHSATPRAVRGWIQNVRINPAAKLGENHRVTLTLVPKLELLKLRTNSRIFQEKSVREIVTEIFQNWKLSHEWRLSSEYEKKLYCTQYQESDFEFVTRLLASEGIFFYFEHASPHDDAVGETPEKLILLDNHAAYSTLAFQTKKITQDSSLLVMSNGQADPELNEMLDFQKYSQLAPESFLLSDYDFRKPNLKVRAARELPKPWQSVLGKEMGAKLLQTYMHADLGEDESEKSLPEISESKASLMLEQSRNRASFCTGKTICYHLTPGHIFQLDNHPTFAVNRDYVVSRVTHKGRSPDPHQSGGEPYENTFECTETEINLRPNVPHERQRQVTETAIVVGGGSDEIYTDSFGRIKVQFHWDLQGSNNDHSSCWLRVSQPWSGASWGTQFIPRVGMEVLVTFLGGDVDRPLVTGCLYNGTHPTPFELPEEKTRSGIRTQSTSGTGGFNELSFQDQSGNEQVFLRAEKDYDQFVKNNFTTSVGDKHYMFVKGEQQLNVGGEQKCTIQGKQNLFIEKDHMMTVKGSSLQAISGNLDTRVSCMLNTRVDGQARFQSTGDVYSEIKADKTLCVEGHLTTVVGQHDAQKTATMHVEGSHHLYSSARTEIVAEKGLVIRCGKSTIRLTPESIEINSPSIFITSDDVAVQAEKTMKLVAKKEQLFKSDKLMLKAEQSSLALNKMAKLDGQLVKINCGPDPVDDEMPDAEPIKPTTVSLVDEDGKPVPKQRFIMVFPDGTERSGFLDDDGKAELELEESGEIIFPDVDEPKQS
jgi:type VI secretion system secreted protein VgrG